MRKALSITRLPLYLSLLCLGIPNLYADNIVRTAAPISNKAGQSSSPALPNSCLAVRNTNPGSQSGVYDLTIGGAKTSVYCDMITDGGGWTLIGRAYANDVGDWAKVAGRYNWPQSPSPNLQRSFRLGDQDIAGIPRGAFKVVSTGYNNTRFWKGSCVYQQLVPAAGDCAISYSSETWQASSAKGRANNGAQTGGLHDYYPNSGFYIQTSAMGNPPSGWAAGNGLSVYDSGTGSAGTRISLLIWVR